MLISDKSTLCFEAAPLWASALVFRWTSFVLAPDLTYCRCTTGPLLSYDSNYKNMRLKIVDFELYFINAIFIVNAKSKFVLNRCQKAPYVISYTKEVRDIMKVRKYKNDPLELDRKLKGILKENTDIELGYKLSFISMVLNGALPKDVAEYCVHDERAIQKWVKIADEQGFDALKRKKKEGRPPLLNPEQKAEIKAVLEDPNSLEEYGYCVWDGKTLSEFIKKWYDVDISVRNCQYLFHELGQSLKTPQTFPAHPENPKVREDFKKTLRIAEGSKQYHRVSRRGTFPASDKCDTNLVSYWYCSGG